MIIPVILAGGSGTRLWPLSRQLFPKQFLALQGEKSLLQQTLSRVQEDSFSPPLLLCNEEHRFLAAEQVRQMGLQASILLEPEGRNTAPAIAMAALWAMQQEEDPLLLVLSADHAMADQQAFRHSIKKAQSLAQKGYLVSFGVIPSHAETGYGYICKGKELLEEGYEIEAFIEKPDLQRAQEFSQSPKYFWNSGIFLFRASRYLEELKKHAQDVYQACHNAWSHVRRDADFLRMEKSSFLQSPSISMDYAVMEKTSRAAVVALHSAWSDLGSWAALWQISEKDENGNALQGDVLLKHSQDCYIQAQHRLVAAIGIQDLVVIESKDAVLVAAKDKVQEVKEIVDHLRAQNRSEHHSHPAVYRPWGMFDSIDKGSRYQVKRIQVKPGAKLSLQMHFHRAEHWIVVSGTAKVTCDDKSFMLTENQSTYIPVGAVHSLENPGVLPLELIEVQSGSYLGEDDIVRLEDCYGRVPALDN